jgi:error-prone DNA polymerase
MPEKEGFARLKLVRTDDMPPAPVERAPYVELGITSPFSFLRGASDAIELVLTALSLGMDCLGIADRNTLAGVVRMHSACKSAGLKPLIGCRLDLRDAPSLLAYPIDRDGYGRLSRLLSLGKMRAEKGECDLDLSDVADHRQGIAFIAWPPADLDAFEADLPRLREALASLRHVAAAHLYRGDDVARIERLDRIARAHGCTILATNDVHYHAPDKRPLQDIVTCIREKVTIATAGYLLNPNAERHLKSPDEMARLFARWPHAIEATRQFADTLHFSLDELAYEYPRETVPDGKSPQQYLELLTWQGAHARWGKRIPYKVLTQLNHELGLIERLDFARYFLTVHEIVAFARSLDPPILCQGRGSAANSAVCYCLGITAVDPATSDLLFERFISEKRREPPDIDVDFEHERREEVIQWIYETYGRTHSALTAVVTRYRARGAVREVGKALGLSEDVTAGLSSSVWGWSREGVEEHHAAELNMDMGDRRLMLTLELARLLINTPRHLSQHPGGFVLTRDRLDTLVPIEPAAMADRQVIEWDKDDIDALGFMKVDVLGLGMLSCLRRGLQQLKQN